MKSLASFMLVISSLYLGIAVSYASAKVKVKIELECTVTGTKVTGEKSTRPFIEKLKVEKKEYPTTNKEGKVETPTLIRSDLISDGKNVESSVIAATPEYVVVAYATSIGSGYSRRLLVFTYLLDPKARELTRLVSSLPAGTSERTQNVCKQS